MVKDLQSFKNVFSKSLYEKLIKETRVPYNNISKDDFNKTIEELYSEIISKNYSVGNLREKIYDFKTLFVARIVPVFDYKDELLYYFLIRMIEDEIVAGRVEGTFGGYRLGNAIRKKENEEIEYASGSYNPFLWRKEWKAFNNLIWSTIRTTGFTRAIKLDIANFYDNINLDILEKKLLITLPKTKLNVSHLLIYFLKTWDKETSHYALKNVGIPQSEFGDQSRLLANFYLQDYDFFIKNICEEQNAFYLRYADDQIVFLNEDTDVKKIMYNICKELNKIGLNLNSSKVELFEIEDLEKYYAFEIMQFIDDGRYDDSIELFFKFKKQKIKFREDTVLKRLLNKGINLCTLKNKNKLLKILMDDDFLILNSFWYLEKLYGILSKKAKKQLERKIIELLNTVYYNSFIYDTIDLAEKYKISKIKKCAQDRLKKIKKDN